MRLFLVSVVVVASMSVARADDVNTFDGSGWAPLMTAAEMGKVDDIKALLAKGADIEVSNPKVYSGATPLLIALEFAQHDAAVVLMDRHASIAGDLGKNALVLAARGGLDDIVDRLLKAKVSPEDTLALIAAAKYNYPTTIKKLVKAGASVSAPNTSDHGFTPLIVACQEHSVEAAKALLEAGANVNEVDEDGSSALHWAVFAEQPKEIHEYAAMGQPHDTYWIARKDAPLVALLIAKKVKIGVLDKDKNTALHQAAYMDSGAAAKLLVAAGIDTKAKNRDGLTAYDIAKERNNSVEPLLRPAGAKAPTGPRQHAPEIWHKNN